ncbi:hypothetical protein HID58_070113 [Brassica napus]|uniref:Uncharacterized protein n=1 Tax=Brassica napus TaxID=3708 RepID=A0ABQ7YY00_BRANA|nr:hypothetical protein HID58_070113 [Brassica napus]
MLITSKGNFRSRSSNAIEKKMQMGAPRPELFVHVSLRLLGMVIGTVQV